MARVITFSRTFPAYHPKAGQPTYFVEKIWKGIGIDNPRKQPQMRGRIDRNVLEVCFPKSHTIRAGHRWKIGDKFSPRVWSGKPYQSPQIIIAPDMEVKKVWDFEIKDAQILLNGKDLYSAQQLVDIAHNDGLTGPDFISWFRYPQPFSGQIICWNENENY